MQVRPEDALDLAVRVLTRHEAPEEHARLQGELLVDAEARGHPSHGLQRLPRLVRRIRSGVLDPRAAGEVSWTHSAAARIDGKAGFGAVVADTAMRAISERARTTGIAAAYVYNSNHIGMLAHYAHKLARSGQLLLVTTTSEALVHPWGGTRAMVGTNPLAVGIPTAADPFVFDMATGVVSMGKIHAYAARGEPLEPGWAVTEEGQPTLDSEAAKSGAIAPFGGAKGYGLALAIELLVAELTGAALGRDVRGTLDDDQWSNKGDVFIVAEVPVASLARIADYLDAVRSSPRARPDIGIDVPGDRSSRRAARSRQQGIAIPDALWNELDALAGEEDKEIRK